MLRREKNGRKTKVFGGESSAGLSTFSFPARRKKISKCLLGGNSYQYMYTTHSFPSKNILSISMIFLLLQPKFHIYWDFLKCTVWTRVGVAMRLYFCHSGRQQALLTTCQLSCLSSYLSAHLSANLQ